MGNSESIDTSISRAGSVKTTLTTQRNRSQSPVLHRRSGSTRRTEPIQPGEPFRRSKTCRVRDRTTKKAVCMTTGLTLHQKALLTRKWNRMDRATVYEIGRLMFENVFQENPQYLSYIDLKDEPNWMNHINFKIHVQRFNTALVECMRRLRDPSAACDILRDFGASYATNSKRVTPMFFERLANSLNKAAAQLQEADHLEIEKNKCQLVDDTSTNTLTVESDRSTLRSCASSCDMLSAERTIVSRSSDSQMETLLEETKKEQQLEKQSCCSSSQKSCGTCASLCCRYHKSLCPITAEAWIVLSAFLANQIKLGYEL
ncbi:unnamed protein product, partial [Auanema sp. JU1783]